MATTQKGTYYPSDYSKIADVPADMKKMAESIDEQTDNLLQKEEGKGLSSNDFTNELKTKLNNLENYDDTEVKQDISNLDTNKASKAELQEATIALQAELLATRKDLQAGTLEGQAEGESLYLADSSDARFRSFGTGGNSKQETRVGYNLIEQKVTSMTGANSEISFDEEGFMTASNSSDKTSYINITADSSRITTGKSYTLKTEFKGEGSAVFLMNSASDYSKNTTESGSLTNTATTSYMNVLIALQSNTTTKVRFTLVEGITEKEYEQYGAMPSLEFSSEVQAVGQDVNLFDKDNVTKINAYLDENSKKITTNANARTLYIPCKPNKIYTILKKESARFGAGTCNVLPSNNVICNNAKVPNVGTEVSIETGNTDTYLCVFYYLSTVDTLTEQEILDSIKIVEGTEINGYSPYNCGSANVTVCNKNTLGFVDFTHIENGITVDCKDNKMHISGTATKGFFIFLTRYCNIKEINKIILNKKITLSSVVSAGIELNVGVSGNSYYMQLKGNTKTVAKVIDKEISTIYLYIPNNTTINQDLNIQLELDNVTDYIPHEEQNFTMPVQQEMLEGDYLDLDNEEEVHTWKKVIFDGTENWAKSTNTNNVLFYIPDIFAYKDGTILCNYFKSTAVWDKDVVGVELYPVNGLRFGLGKNADINTIEKWKAKLQELYNAGTPLTIYYKLATPTKLPITDSQKSVAKQIRETLHSYKGGTHVYSVDEISTIFNVRYTRDLNAVINNLSQQAIEGGN